MNYNENDDDILSNIFSNTSFVNDRSSNFKKEESLVKRQLQYRTLSSKDHENRIKYFLDRQKEKRRSLLTHVRNLVSLPINQQQEAKDIDISSGGDVLMDYSNLDKNSNNNNIDNNNIDNNIDSSIDNSNNNNKDEAMKSTSFKQNKKDKFKEIKNKSKQDKKHKQALLYSNHLMLAEGLTYIPNNLEREWYCVPVPLGYRCLVISHNDNTVVRCENGEVLFQFKSLLPFGSEKSRETAAPPNQHCILDCIYEELSGTFYILDILSWKGFILYDSETEFRFFWRDTKVKENISITKYSSSNSGYRFIVPPYFTSNSDSLEQIKFDKLLKHQQENQQNQILEYKTEFLLFYHKNSHYEFGTTPLFCSLSMDYIDMLIDHLNYKYKEKDEDDENMD